MHCIAFGLGVQNTSKDIKWVKVNLPMTINNPGKAEALVPDSICSWYSVLKTSVPSKYRYSRLVSWY